MAPENNIGAWPEGWVLELQATWLYSNVVLGGLLSGVNCGVRIRTAGSDAGRLTAVQGAFEVSDNSRFHFAVV